MSKEDSPVTTERPAPVIIPEMKARRDVLLKGFKAIDDDPKVAERAEEFAREVGYISPEDLNRQFTI